MGPVRQQRRSPPKSSYIRPYIATTKHNGSAPCECQPVDFIGAGERNRTLDLLITNELLYQLSYTGEDRDYRQKESVGLSGGVEIVRQAAQMELTAAVGRVGPGGWWGGDWGGRSISSV